MRGYCRTRAWRRGSVEIAAFERDSGSRQVYEASRLLVTLPLGVLKQEQGTEGAVLFEPPLIEEGGTHGLEPEPDGTPFTQVP
jgi:hypothetical protein